MKLTSLCVYCGSSPGVLPEYAEAATQLGRLLASEGITLVYGGGNVGLMKAVADGALAANGRVIGVMPQMLIQKEVAHLGLTELHAVSTMHERKMMMAQRSDGFIAMPGGIGTLDEIFEALTWNQLGLQHKPIAFYSVADFYNPLMDFLEHMVRSRFLKSEHYQNLIVESSATQMLNRMRDYQPAHTAKWLDREA